MRASIIVINVTSNSGYTKQQRVNGYRFLISISFFNLKCDDYTSLETLHRNVIGSGLFYKQLNQSLSR